MPNYLYVAGPEEGPVKIGFSSRPFARMSQIRTSSPADVRMIGCFEVSEPEKTKLIEQTVHLVLRDHPMNGEWFSVTASQAIDAVRKTSKATGIGIYHSSPNGAPKAATPESPARRGPKPSGTAKKLISLRLDPDVIDGFKSSGEGWQSRINEALRKSLNL